MNTPAALKDIAPFWDAKITKTKSTTRLRWKSTVPSAGLQRLVLGAYDCCIVAEAYGFTNDYVIIDDGRMIEGEWPCYDCTKGRRGSACCSTPERARYF